MKIYLLIIILTLLSCSNNEKFSSEKAYKISIDEIYYEKGNSNKLYIHANLLCGSENDLERCSLRNLDGYLSNYFWVVNGDTVIRYDDFIEVNAIYGLNSVKLVLIDDFRDTISDSIYIKVNEPLKINLLSPIDEFSGSTTDNVIFQYELSGVDGWEQVQSFVYVSIIKESLWNEENILTSNILTPPIDEQIYYWGVKAFTEQGTVFSDIRWIWLKN